MFVETSALAAIILEEDGWRTFATKIGTAKKPITTAVVIFETVLAVTKQKKISPIEAHEIVKVVVERANIAVSAVVPAMIDHAVTGRELFGKGRHPAQLNMGDCFSYGAAKYYGATLLFKGNEFGQTDITPA